MIQSDDIFACILTCPMVYHVHPSPPNTLSYASSYNNQRIALQNALLLSYHLNRTLLLPPLLLGSRPIPLHTEPELYEVLSSSLSRLPELEKICPPFFQAERSRTLPRKQGEDQETFEKRVERERRKLRKPPIECRGWDKRSFVSWETMLVDHFSNSGIAADLGPKVAIPDPNGREDADGLNHRQPQRFSTFQWLPI